MLPLCCQTPRTLGIPTCVMALYAVRAAKTAHWVRCSGAAELPSGVTARVAGVAMLSFVPATREQFETLQPPDDAAYLSNTAVDAAFRR